MLIAITRDASVFKSVLPALKAFDGFALKAVRLNGNALEHVCDTLRGNREIVLAAVSNCADALKYADPDFVYNDHELAVAAVKKNPEAL
tara:strand:- start:384 stop:650 length:267 start_codon:yes stop_codon:yes gene_type:complete